MRPKKSSTHHGTASRRTRDDKALVLHVLERLVEEGHAILWLKSEGADELLLSDGATFALASRGVRRIR